VDSIGLLGDHIATGVFEEQGQSSAVDALGLLGRKELCGVLVEPANGVVDLGVHYFDELIKESINK
jgi:hypothetical protein